jgi:hypothetical protein
MADKVKQTKAKMREGDTWRIKRERKKKERKEENNARWEGKHTISG